MTDQECIAELEELRNQVVVAISIIQAQGLVHDPDAKTPDGFDFRVGDFAVSRISKRHD